MTLKRVLIFIVFLVLTAGLVYLFSFSTEQEPTLTDDDYRQAFHRNYKVFVARMPDEIDFAGEEVPLDRFDVREGLDRELLVNSYWHSNTQLMFKRAFRYFPVIDSILAVYDMPADFRYLAMIESGLQNVVSPAGARGFWQFMKGTATELGLEINAQVDERYHLEKSTVAACKYLREAKERFGSWTLASAAYNMGSSRTGRVLEDQQEDNYYDLYLNPETARYVYRILAVKTIYGSPREYGFYFREKDFYPPLETKTVETDSTEIDLVDFAKSHGVSYKILTCAAATGRRPARPPPFRLTISRSTSSRPASSALRAETGQRAIRSR
ncbi:MAG: lytic transglycosylase domain-containing protein, partial [Bacteroidales bacterium]